jgi:hypothetical protein
MEDKPYYMSSHAGDFGRYRLEDELLHPGYEKSVGTNLTETHLFGFHVPEKAIHAMLYAWQHPNLHLISGGVHVMQGIKSHAPAAEISDYRHFMSDAAFREGFPNYRLDNGYQVEMLELGRRFRTTYADKARNSSFEVEYTAVSEPIMWPGDRHFEQVVRTKGVLMLRGTPHKIDGFYVRDRSWGQPRPEDPVNAPPHTWITGVFDEDSAFHLTATDDPARNPAWKSHFPHFDPAHTVKFGWLIVKGRKTRIKSASKLTSYDRATLMPMTIDIRIVDENDKAHDIKGTVVAGTPLHLWHNIRVPVCLARWEYEGKVGWGDVQDVQYSDFVLLNC